MGKILLLACALVGCAVARADDGGLPPPQAIVVDFPAIVNDEGRPCTSTRQCAFTVRLAQPPASNVAVLIAQQPTGKIIVAPSPVGFTPSNYANPQNVLMLGKQDADALDENITLTLTATDGVSDLAPPVHVYAIVIDDDHP